jgi:hypothetical protein
VRFATFGASLTMLLDTAPVAGETAAIYWGALHELDAGQSTLPTAHEDVVLAGAAGYAALEWASFATNRINAGGEDAGEDYRVWAEDRLRTFRQQLDAIGHNARLRSSRLFAPATSQPHGTFV